MGMKKKLGMGVVTAMLGLSLIGGGTYAYFSDKEVSQNTFAAGTLDLSVDPEVVINVDNLKPGDEMERGFQLVNKGTLTIGDVKLLTDYSVIDSKGDNGNADLVIISVWISCGIWIKMKFQYGLLHYLN